MAGFLFFIYQTLFLLNNFSFQLIDSIFKNEMLPSKFEKSDIMQYRHYIGEELLKIGMNVYLFGYSLLKVIIFLLK